MCYYNGQKVTRDEYIRLKSLEKLVSRYDFLNNDLHEGFLYGPTAVCKRIEGETDFDIVPMEWGFIPDYRSWPFIETREDLQKWRGGFKDNYGRFQQLTLLNAVSEEMLLKGKMYRDAALKRRCLVLSSGFYEWRHIFPLNKRTGLPLKTANKIPYHIGVKDKGYFFMAGIWQPWTDASTGEYVESVAIVTTTANKLMEQIHNSKKRMPTILTEDLAWEWLFDDLPEKRITEIGQYMFPAEQMEACTIDKKFRELPEPTKPFVYDDVPALDLTFN